MGCSSGAERSPEPILYFSIRQDGSIGEVTPRRAAPVQVRRGEAARIETGREELVRRRDELVHAVASSRARVRELEREAFQEFQAAASSSVAGRRTGRTPSRRSGAPIAVEVEVVRGLLGNEFYVVDRVIPDSGERSARNHWESSLRTRLSTAPQPLRTNPVDLGALPLVRVSAHDLDETRSCACIICFAEFRLDEVALRLPCDHLYHKDCITKWLMKSNRCPVCKYEMPTEDPAYERTRQLRMASWKLRITRSDLERKTTEELYALAAHLGLNVGHAATTSRGLLLEILTGSSRVSLISGEDCAEAAAGEPPEEASGILSETQSI